MTRAEEQAQCDAVRDRQYHRLMVELTRIEVAQWRARDAAIVAAREARIEVERRASLVRSLVTS